MVGSSNTDPRRRRLFPDTPSVALGQTVGEGQNQFVQCVLQVLADDADFAALQPHAKPIAAAHAAPNAKDGERGGLQAKVAVAGSAHAKAVQAACTAHNTAEPDIKKALGASKTKLVESFFHKFVKARKAKAVA